MERRSPVITDPTCAPVALGPLDDMTGYHLRRASAAFGTDFAQALGGTGMRQVLFGILSVVAANPGINQGAVGRALGIQRANMVALINELVEADRIDRRGAEDSRRAFALTLTVTGRAALDDALVRVRDHEDRMLGALTPDERETLNGLLRRIDA